MSVKDAQEAFYDLHAAVFKNNKESPEKRALILENEMKKLLDAHDLPHETQMSDFSSPGSSKVYVVVSNACILLTSAYIRALCYSPIARLDSYKFFRNYESPQQITEDVTLIEALRATWASPGVLPPISIGPKGCGEMVMSAGNGFANPIREIIKEAYHIFGARAKLSCLLSLGSGFRGVVALDNGRNITHGVCIDCDRVSREVKRGIARLNIYYRLSVDHGLERWDQFRPEFGTMKSHVDDYLGRDEPSNDLDRCVTASITEAVVTLDKIRELTICEISLLTSSRWYQAGGGSIEARTTAAFGILCYA
jgi:hypothetical protein